MSARTMSQGFLQKIWIHVRSDCRFLNSIAGNFAYATQEMPACMKRIKLNLTFNFE